MNYPPLKFWLNVLIPRYGVRHFDGVLGVVFQLVQSEFGWREGSNGRNKVRQLDKQEHSWLNLRRQLKLRDRRATIYYRTCQCCQIALFAPTVANLMTLASEGDTIVEKSFQI